MSAKSQPSLPTANGLSLSVVTVYVASQPHGWHARHLIFGRSIHDPRWGGTRGQIVFQLGGGFAFSGKLLPGELEMTTATARNRQVLLSSPMPPHLWPDWSPRDERLLLSGCLYSKNRFPFPPFRRVPALRPPLVAGSPLLEFAYSVGCLPAVWAPDTMGIAVPGEPPLVFGGHLVGPLCPQSFDDTGIAWEAVPRNLPPLHMKPCGAWPPPPCPTCAGRPPPPPGTEVCIRKKIRRHYRVVCIKLERQETRRSEYHPASSIVY